MREAPGVGTKYDKIFAGGAVLSLPLRGRESDFNSLAKRFSEGSMLEIASEGICFSTGPSLLPLREKVPERSEGG